jgi:excisionase family DNA binding protein
MVGKSFSETRFGRRPLVDARAAGEYAGLSVWTIRKKAYAGEISSLKIGSRLLFNLDELDRYLAEHTRPRLIDRPTHRARSNEFT